MRRSLETARSAWRAAEEAREAADAAVADAALAVETLATRQALFAARISEAGLAAATTPGAAAQTIALVREARRAESDVAAKQEAVATLLARVEAFSARVSDIAGSVLSTGVDVEPDAVSGLVAQLRSALTGASEVQLQRTQQEDVARDLKAVSRRARSA
jgi:hypothetical protein